MPEVNDGSGVLQDEVVDVLADDLNLEPEVEVEEKVAEDKKQEPEENPAIPAKFRGKSVEEIIESYSNLEREFGRRSNEVGELRKTIDDYLKQQLASAGRTTDDGEFGDEDEGRDKHKPDPDVIALKNEVHNLKVADAKKEFEKAHPDYQDVVASEEFVKWVTSSTIRTRAFQEANANYDYATAKELFDEYKAVTESKRTTTTQQREKDMTALANAKPAAGGTAPAGKRKVYKLSDLEKLKAQNPDRYEKLYPLVTQAYREGRVIRDI